LLTATSTIIATRQRHSTEAKPTASGGKALRSTAVQMRRKRARPDPQEHSSFAVEAESSSTKTTTAMTLAIAAKGNTAVEFLLEAEGPSSDTQQQRAW
jgi:hypothetical protein